MSAAFACYYLQAGNSNEFLCSLCTQVGYCELKRVVHIVIMSSFAFPPKYLTQPTDELCAGNRNVTRGDKVGTMPRAPNHWEGADKSQQCCKYFIQHSTSASERR